MNRSDVVIIGAGPIGIYAGFYAGMRGLSAIVVEELEIPGGQLATLYPEKYIYDIAAYPKIKAIDLVDNLMEQVSRFDTTSFMLNTKVIDVAKNNDEFIIHTSNGDITTKSVIIAAGNGAFSPRKLGVEGEENLDNLQYFIQDPSVYANKKVAIFGGGDSAVDFSLMIKDIASEVNIIHRRNEFRAHDHSVELLKDSNVNIFTPFTPVGATMHNVEITNGEKNVIIDVDNIICNFGFVTNLGNIDKWGLELDLNKIVVDTRHETNIAGIFAIGDICTYPGRASMIACGFGEAPIAINSCYLHINPGAKIGALHSSTKFKEQ